MRKKGMLTMPPTPKDHQFIQFLLQNTDSGKLKWEPTADVEYTASFKGEYNATVEQRIRGGAPLWILTLRDSAGRELLKIDDEDDNDVVSLYNKVVRAALNVDKALDEIMGDYVDPNDIPF